LSGVIADFRLPIFDCGFPIAEKASQRGSQSKIGNWKLEMEGGFAIAAAHRHAIRKSEIRNWKSEIEQRRISHGNGSS
jgi:hypothetical protein